MRTDIIHKIFLFAFLLFLPILITKCKITDFILHSLTSSNSISCRWGDWANAIFLNPELRLPDFTCDEPFENHDIATLFPSYSFYELLVTEPNYMLTWTASVYGKTCDTHLSNSHESQQMVFTHDDVYGRLYRTTYDWIEVAPLIETNNDIGVNDLKHELVFQLYDVTNTLDNSMGTITWTKTWEGQHDASYTDYPISKWEFDFSSEPMIGSYNPKSGYPRAIYVYNQYIYQ